ncbi:MAG: MMPL family transporter [Paludibacter sp.]|nr:MMPL family transporter [Bacteroidales bacterium]MCM1069547.1 MMPL family transporter [Prevotella sp.]MCM1354193.1 MMPL family transporter [Bacteroides sp.]MCM1443068.1 MMPL family transporter [Muribaculum sp.]MCM1482267.1 MMPL family transporter [Paludibacter sp.]
MLKVYRYMQSHKWLLYVTLCATTLLFVYYALQTHFEENLVKLLPQTENNLNVDLAFQDLKVKDMLFVQVTGDERADTETLAEAMDVFMEGLLAECEEEGLLNNALYTLDPSGLMEPAQYLLVSAPAWLDFTDAEMDSLTSVEHIRTQVEAYNELLETEMGMMLYDFMAYDPCGILLSRLNVVQGKSDNDQRTGFKLLNGHFYSADETVCIGFLSPHISSTDSGTSKKLLRHIKHVSAVMSETYPGIQVLYHGTIIQSANNSERIKKDLILTLGISLLLILTLLAICFKDPVSMLLLLLPVAYGTFMALAILYWCQGGMSLMALSIGAIVLGVAMSYSLHVVVHFKYTGDRERVVREQSNPVFLGSLTTIGAFAGLLFTQSALLRDFGWFAALSITGTTLASLFFLPHFFPKKNIRNEHAFRFMERVNAYPIDKNKYVLIVLLCFVTLTIAFSGKYRFDPNLRHINYTAPEVQEALQLWAEKQNNGLTQQYYASIATDLDVALMQLEGIEHVCDSLQEAGTIGTYQKTSAILPSLQRQQERINHWQRYFSADKRAAVWRNVEVACRQAGMEADMFLPFADAMQADYTPCLILDNDVIPDEFRAVLAEKLGDYWLVFMPVKMPADSLAHTNDCLAAVEGCMVLDPYYYSTNLVEMIHDDFDTILWVSSVFVLLVLLLAFRRLLLALIAYVPMLLSWYVVLGSMALTGQDFNIINIIVSSFIFGIGVDYSIFIMDGLLAAARGEDTHRLVYHKTAITMSATILVVCMASLLFAVHPAIRSIGFASLVGMITTMFLSYVLQPWLFRLALRNDRIRKSWTGK